MASWGYASGAQGSVAPFVAATFGLSDRGMASLTAWLGFSALGALWLGRVSDRVGRRRVVLGSALMLALGCGFTAVARDPASYVLAQLVTLAAGASLAATVAVMLAEELTTHERARGQARAGLAFAAASSLPLLAVSALAECADPWRWVWLFGVLPALGLPWLWIHVRDTEAWRAADLRGETRAARLGDVFRGAHRATTVRLLVAMVLVGGVDAASRAWLFYHPVRGLGLDPRQAAAVLVVGGGLGMLGFRSGAWLADRFGRRLAFSIAAVAMGVGVAGYYLNPPDGTGSITGPGGFVRLIASLALLAHAGNAAGVAFRSIVAEMMPTCLRGAIGGWLATGTALGWLGAMSAIAALTPIVGGIGPAVVAVVCLALPTACLVLIRLPETAGVELDVAASPSLGRPSY